MDLYRIADLYVQTNTSEYLSENFKTFACSEDREGDICIIFDKSPRRMYELMQAAVNEKLLLWNNYMSLYETEEHFTLVIYNDRKFVGTYIYKARPFCEIFVDDTEVPRGVKGYENPYGITEEELLGGSFREAFSYWAQQMGRTAIHSSSILYEGRGWLFSGCSGSGKSTHVQQWKRAELPIEVIDGDIAMIYKKENQYVVAGLPWCGTSEEFSTIVAPLGGIFFLEKDSSNFVRELPYVDRVLLVNAESISPNWKRELMSLNLDRAEEICQRALVAELHCTPELEAAETMKRYIDCRLDVKTE